jgi:hypothetical protein
MSEVLLLSLLLPLLYASEEAADNAASWQRDAALGAAMGTLALVRTHAVVLILAFAAVLTARRQWRRAACSVGAALCVLAPWQIWVALKDRLLPAPLRGSYGSYLPWFREGVVAGGPKFLWRTAVMNAQHGAALLGDRFAPWPPGIVRLAVTFVVVALLALGCFRLRRQAPVTMVFLLLYLATALLWPYAPWRFIWAIWPLLLILVGEGWLLIAALTPRIGQKVVQGVAQRAVQVTALVVAAVLLVGIGRAEFETYRTRAWTLPARTAARQIAPVMRWVRRNTDRQDVVIADAEPLVYLFTERRALPPTTFTASEYVRPRSTSGDAAALRELVTRYPARYVVTVVPSTRAAARSLGRLRGSAPSLRQIADLPNGGAFEVRRP